MKDTLVNLLKKNESLQYEWVISKKKAREARERADKLRIAEDKAYDLFYESVKELRDFDLSSRLPNPEDDCAAAKDKSPKQ